MPLVRAASLSATVPGLGRRGRRPAHAALALCLLFTAGCSEARGLISVTVVSAPGDQPLADAVRVRLSLSDPPASVEAGRNEDGGFDLAIEVDAEGQAGFLDFEAFNAAGQLVAVGGTPFLPITAVDAAVSIFVAPPNSFRASPAELPFSAAGSAIVPLPFGALLAGGGLGQETAADDIVVYNAFRHELQVGVNLPRPLSGMAAAAGANGAVFLFGGTTGTADVADALRFDTNVPPAGDLFELDVEDGLERSFEDMVPIRGNRFLITGNPTAILEAGTLRVRAAGLPATTAPAVSLLDADGVLATVVTLADGRPGLVGEGEIAPIDAPTPRAGHAAAATADGRVLWVGGSAGDVVFVRDAVVIDPAAGTASALELDVDFQPVALARRVDDLFAFGAAGEVARFDATTLARRGPTEVVRVRGATLGAATLPNGQLAIVGGDNDGVAVPEIDLFTPAPGN